MSKTRWLAVVAVAGLCACGGSRDRPPGTRSNNTTNTNNNTGTVFDSGVSTEDAGTVEADGGVVDPSGLDRNADISTLSTADLGVLCEVAVERTGSEPVDCGDGLIVEPVDYDECVSGTVPSGCTVGQYLDCLDSLDGNLCNLFQTVECQAIFECGQ